MESNIFVFRGSYDVLWTVFYQAFGWQLLLDLRGCFVTTWTSRRDGPNILQSVSGDNNIDRLQSLNPFRVTLLNCNGWNLKIENHPSSGSVKREVLFAPLRHYLAFRPVGGNSVLVKKWGAGVDDGFWENSSWRGWTLRSKVGFAWLCLTSKGTSASFLPFFSLKTGKLYQQNLYPFRPHM